MATSIRVLLDEPEDPRENDVDLRLTYNGELLASRSSSCGKQEDIAKVADKHRIRRHFHKQLKLFWENNPNLSMAPMPSSIDPPKSAIEELADNWKENGFRFVPRL